MARIAFKVSGAEDLFGKELHQRVNDYFETGARSPKSNFSMYLKTFTYFGAYIAIYVLLLSGLTSAGWTYFLWLGLGVLIPAIGFNIGHDAIHGAYSHRRWVNVLLGESFSFIGADVRTWKILHNTIHHSYTNIWKADGDLMPVPLLRFHPASRRRVWHKAQIFYAPVLYCFTSLVWVFKKDFQYLFKKEHLVYHMPNPTPKDVIKLFAVKAAYYFAFLVIPLWMLPGPWWQALLGFFLMHFTAGFILAIVFQLGHVVEGPEFVDPKADERVRGSWNEHQLKTSANFSMNAVSLWIFGGLNYQIEHHLFPRICHVHYPALSQIVREVSLKYRLPYHFHPSLVGAIRSHFRTLKDLG